jgi:hypothetical protein
LITRKLGLLLRAHRQCRDEIGHDHEAQTGIARATCLDCGIRRQDAG